MPKGRRVGGSKGGKSRKPSRSKSSGFGRSKKSGSGFGGEKKQSDDFVKPPHDPGPKIRPSGDQEDDRPILDRLAEAAREAQEGTDEEPSIEEEALEAVTGGGTGGGGGRGCPGCGCCSLPLFAAAAAVVTLVVLLLAGAL